MATSSAVAATSEAVVRLLRSSYDPADFNQAPLDFQVYVAENFQRPMDEGVSLLLYRVYPDGTNRTPPGRLLPNGRRNRPKLPLELHFLLTAWARTASLQHEIVGWLMRTLEDNPVLYPSLLNAYRSDVFLPEETVEIAVAQLSVEDLFHIWEVMISHVYQLSVPYVARVVRIDSKEETAQGIPVQQRIFDLREPEVLS